MKLVVNDREVDVPSETPDIPTGPTVATLLAGLGYPEQGIAVAVDATVVPRSQWASAQLRPGVRVDVVTAVQGG